MICTANASGNIGEDVFVNEIMTSVHVPKPVRDISKPTLMREIRTAKRQVLSACAPVDAQLSAMEYAMNVLLMVADNKHNTSEKWETIYDMRRAVLALKRL